MAKNQSFFLSKKGKTTLNYVYSLGAAMVIAGALFKLMHWPGAKMMLILGMGTEVLIFIISAFEPQFAHHSEYEWERVYPELADDTLGSSAGAAGKPESLTQKLDEMLSESSIEHDMLNRLGSNLGKLSDNVSKMSEMGELVGAANDFGNNARSAANALGEMKDAYAAATSSANSLASSVGGFSEAMESMSTIKDDTMRVKEQMNALTTNLSSLNNVYGNMLSAMRPNA